MTGNTIGERFLMLIFGESHGECVGALIDGCPAGLPLSEQDVQGMLDLRRPGTSVVSTSRSESDKVEILSGIFQGYTTGAPICLLVRNTDVDSRPYETIRDTPRPGHADYVARAKYQGYNDWRGGGRFSGRMTASLVMGGAVAKKLLSYVMGVEITAYTLEIGDVKAEGFTLDDAKKFRYANDVRCPKAEAARLMVERILEERRKGDSLGGVIECVAENLPVGLGEPIFGSLDSDLSRAYMSIPAVKGVEFGSGFAASRRRGSENSDPYAIQDGKVAILSNNAGGILGGLSTGLPLVARVAFKPVSSIAKPQRSVNVETLEDVELIVPGRHDPCVVPRAVPVVECVTAMVLADHAIRAGFIPPVLGGK